MLYTSVRTQIYLPKKLKEEIERQSRQNGNSMAEFLRQAAEEKIENSKRKEESLQELAKRVFGGPPRQTAKEIEKRIKQIREDRRRDDEHMLKRLREARAK